MGEQKVRKDYTGQRFGSLTVKKMLYGYRNRQTYCECECDCGGVKIAYMGNITSGKTRSCGHLEKESRHTRKHSDESIVGQKFGQLTVIQDSGKRASNGAVLWECLCDCGNKTLSGSANLKRGHTTSCGCIKAEFLKSCRKDVVGQKYGCLTIESDIRSENGKRIVLCKCDCGSLGEYSLSDVTTGHTSSCGCMFKSKGEEYIKLILDELNIAYTTQKRFKDCRNKRPLPFDFYLPHFNICIEYNGKQHYEPVKFWGGEKRFEERKRRDQIKIDYCNNNKIHLICLPYTLSNKEIKNIIYSILDPVTTTVA